MKNCLLNQTTEFDCGPTSVHNALRFLFHREELEPDLLKKLFLLCTDAYNGKGEEGHCGTSRAALRYLADWFNDYAQSHRFPIEALFLCSSDVSFSEGSRLLRWLTDGGAAVIRCMSGDVGHYILLTGLENGMAAAWDPYEDDQIYTLEQDNASMVYDRPRECNRLILLSQLSGEGGTDYECGPIPKRDALLLRRTAPADETVFLKAFQ